MVFFTFWTSILVDAWELALPITTIKQIILNWSVWISKRPSANVSRPALPANAWSKIHKRNVKKSPSMEVIQDASFVKQPMDAWALVQTQWAPYCTHLEHVSVASCCDKHSSDPRMRNDTWERKPKNLDARDVRLDAEGNIWWFTCRPSCCFQIVLSLCKWAWTDTKVMPQM